MEVVPCPSRDEWARFSAGGVNDDRLDAMAIHLDHCVARRNLLTGLDQRPTRSFSACSGRRPRCQYARAL